MVRRMAKSAAQHLHICLRKRLGAAGGAGGGAGIVREAGRVDRKAAPLRCSGLFIRINSGPGAEFAPCLAKIFERCVLRS